MKAQWIERGLALTRWVDHLQPLALLAARLYVSSVFFKSGLVKIADWGSTLALFRDEYQVPVLPPELAAHAGTFGELLFPVLVTLGLAGRIGAAGLFFVNLMAVVSYPQLFGFECPAGIHFHYFWGCTLALLVVFGPGSISLDAWLARRLGNPRP
ncbi:MAG: DoxX family protein [Burkholderiales bacterium]|nr:DoxX family protein [Burkholderiales bacterium]